MYDLRVPTMCQVSSMQPMDLLAPASTSQQTQQRSQPAAAISGILCCSISDAAGSLSPLSASSNSFSRSAQLAAETALDGVTTTGCIANILSSVGSAICPVKHCIITILCSGKLYNWFSVLLQCNVTQYTTWKKNTVRVTKLLQYTLSVSENYNNNRNNKRM